MRFSRLLSVSVFAALSVVTPTPHAEAAPYAYVANMGAGSVSVIDVATNVVIATIALPFGSDARHLVASRDGARVYVSAGGSQSSVYVIDTRTHALLPPAIPAGSSPSGMAASPGSSFVYLADQFSGTLFVIDTAQQTVAATVSVGGQPTGVGVLPDGSRVYVANCLGDAVTVLDASTLQPVGNPIPVQENPQALTVSPDGSRVYVSNFNSDTVSVINTASNTVEATIPVGYNPLGMDVTPDGRRLFVADQTASGGSIAVIDTATNTLVARVALPDSNAPRHVAVAPDGARAYVTINNPHQVIVFDPTTDQVVGNPVPLANIPEGIAIADVPPQDELRKLAPANGAADVRPAVGLAWLPAAGVTTYEYCYDTTDNDRCDEGWTATSTTSAVLAGLQTSTKYFWQVREGDRGADGGVWWSFTMAPAPPGAFAKLTPPNLSASSLPVTLSWTPAAGATSYEVGYARPGSGVAASVSAGTSTSVTLTDLVVGATYHWWVWAMNGGGTTAADDNTAWSFTVQAAAPSPFAKNAPANLSQLQPTALSLSWHASAGAVTYEYCYDRVNNGACDSSWIPAGSGTSAWVSDLQRGATYYWQVRATNSWGTTYADGGVVWSFGTMRPRPYDFFHTGRSDIGIWRPETGSWYIRKSTSDAEWTVVQWGVSALGDKPVPADFDGDGSTDIAVWRAPTGTWWVKKSSTSFREWFAIRWGAPADRPVAGDYDGDGAADLAVWRPSNGMWYVLSSSTGYEDSFAVHLGDAALGDVPIPADFDGDGRMDMAVWRPGDGLWYIRTSANGYATFFAVQWGAQSLGDIPAVGDFDGDGRADVAVWRRTNGLWYIRKSSTSYQTWFSVQWGVDASGDVPVVADFDGDGRTDIAVWRRGSATWYIKPSSTSYSNYFRVQWGTPGDKPLGALGR